MACQVRRRLDDWINMVTEDQMRALEGDRRRLRETGEVRHADTWYAKNGRAVLVRAHIFVTDDGFVGVMKGRRVQLDTRPRLRQIINLRLPEDLIAAIEDLRGDMPRERFLRRVIASYVEAARRGEPPGS